MQGFGVKIVLGSLALTLSSWAAHAAVQNSEGRVQDAQAQVSVSRASKYDSAPASGMPDESQRLQTHTKKEAFSVDGAQLSTARPATVMHSEHASLFNIYDAGIELLSDRDGDGYHRHFKLRFDADVLVGDAKVYAKLYIRRVGDTSAWQLYHVTDDFWIYGTSSTDDYYVDTHLDSGFPTSDYDILIDLYESGYSGVVATLDAYDDSSLASVPLEESGLDSPIEISGYQINDVATTLLIDDDHDGYASKFRVTFDPDTDAGVRYAYAVLWVRPQGGNWIREAESDDFAVDPTGTGDAFSFTADWLNGYPTSRYDIQIDLYDSTTGLLAATAGSEWSELSRVPLEDQAHDAAANPPSAGGGHGSTSSYEHGGGAMSWWFGAGLLMLLALRMAYARQKRRELLLTMRVDRKWRS